jgi:hypothetical protein
MEKPAMKRVAAAALLMPLAAMAADWELNPSIEAGYLIDNNYRLLPPGSEIEVQGPLVDAQLEMRARAPSGGEFSFTPRVRATYFPDEQDLDSTDYFADLYWLHQGQRVRTEIRLDGAQQDVVNSEQPDAEVPNDANLGDVDLGDSGRVLVDNRRTRGSLRPEFSFELSPRRSLEFGANVTDVSYDEEIPGAQVDYRYGDITAGYVTQVSQTSSFTTRLRGAQYEIDFQGDSTSYGVELQWDTRNAADRRTFLRGGAQRVDFEDGGSATAWLAGGGVSLVAGRNQLFADLTRSVGPSSAGIVITRDQLRLRWTRDLTPRLSFLAGIRGTHDEDVNSDQPLFNPRSYATGDIGLLWRWQEEFALRVAADYTWQKYDDSLVDDATSSGAMVSILYEPLQRRR